MEARNKRDYAIVVGISRYGSLRPELEGPERDAADFEKWLLDPDGGAVPKAQVKTIRSSQYVNDPKDPWSFQPSLSEVTKEFAKYIGLTQRNAEKAPRVGRRLYLYLSGHGLTPKRDVNTPVQGSALAMANFMEDSFFECLPGMSYANWFKESHSFEEIVLFMDCCRDDRPEVMNSHFIPDIVGGGRPQDVRVFYAWATRWDSRAWEMPLGTPLEKRGVFTFALLEALRQGTPDSQGHTTANGIASHIGKRIPQLRQGDASQGPQFFPDPPGHSIVFLDRPKGTALASVTVSFAAALHGLTAELLDGGLNPMRSTPISSQPWLLELQKGIHVIRVGPRMHPVIVNWDGGGAAQSVQIDG